MRKRRRARRNAVPAVATAAIAVLAIFGVLLLPTRGETKPEEFEAVQNDYHMTQEDFEEFCRQRDAYYQEQMEESGREVEAMERARAEFEEAEQRRAETELKFSRAYYNYPEPFNAPPIIWYEEDLEGFQEYKIPDEYEREGGYFPDITQEYLWVICREKNLDWVIMTALYEGESGYHFDAIGKAGDSGYGQIVPSINKELLERLEVKDILNPYENILVSCTLMEWLLQEYDGSYEKALTAYNAGTGGAYANYFSAGVSASPYAKRILKKADRIRKEMQDAAEDR